MKKYIIIAVTIGLSLTMMIGCETSDDITSDEYNAEIFAQIDGTIMAFSEDSLSNEEITGLILMREEEKLARDVYLHLYETWGLRIFNNIASSEATHMYAIKVLIDRYDLEDPVAEDVVGEFENENLAVLYSSLTAMGDSSFVNALSVGATIEDLDIYDLMELTVTADNDDILFTYDNLTRGSRNHIRSYTSNLSRYGVVYSPQFISATLLDSILSTPKERGNW